MLEGKGTLRVSVEYGRLRPALRRGTDNRQINEENTLYARHQCSGKHGQGKGKEWPF